MKKACAAGSVSYKYTAQHVSVRRNIDPFVNAGTAAHDRCVRLQARCIAKGSYVHFYHLQFCKRQLAAKYFIDLCKPCCYYFGHFKTRRGQAPYFPGGKRAFANRKNMFV